MKWSIVGLVVAGFVAAVAAALLVSSLRNGRQANAAVAVIPDVEVMYASQDLSATTVIDPKCVIKKKVPINETPEDCLRDPAQVVGRALCVPMSEGQPFTTNCFADKDSGISFATVLHSGMRAVSLSLTDSSAMAGLLYPGSVVDVLASFRKLSRSDSSQSETVSLTLLQGVKVLAVEENTVVSAEKDQKPDKGARTGFGPRQLVTLMVTPREAELLQLAQVHGTISLAMRNPLDSSDFNKSRGRPRQMSDLFDTQEPSVSSFAGPLAGTALPAVADASAEWSVVFIRGASSHVETFPLPDEEE